MTEEKLQQFLTWLEECEAKENCLSVHVSQYSWYDKARLETFRYIKEMFTAAFKEELQ